MKSKTPKSKTGWQPRLLGLVLGLLLAAPAIAGGIQGEEWLEDRLGESVELYRQRVAAGEVSPDFLDRYRGTLEFAAAYRGRGTSDDLTAIIRRAFGIS